MIFVKLVGFIFCTKLIFSRATSVSLLEENPYKDHQNSADRHWVDIVGFCCK